MHSDIRISDYTYILPDERVAKYPLAERDSSRLLICKNHAITEDKFSSIVDYLPDSSHIIFNNTRVVPARLLFRKDTGALIEIFCLEPVSPADYARSFASLSPCRWRVIIGNAKRWKSGRLSINTSQFILYVELIEKETNSYIVEFSWNNNLTFSEVIDLCGKIPIPPYLNRDTELIDYERYQTLYAKYRGSVAAPTAGLHFTDEVLERLKIKGISMDNICLHVGAGTFIPVKGDNISDHQMHSEPFSVTKEFLKRIIDYKSLGEQIIAVGTTTVRTLESLYYLGLQCNNDINDEFRLEAVSQWDPYSIKEDIGTIDAISKLLRYMERRNLDTLEVKTSIIIVPSFKFRITDVMVTNFHQPQSTLLLLVAAFIGEDWRKVYEYALQNEFRFLSYGDSSLLIR